MDILRLILICNEIFAYLESKNCDCFTMHIETKKAVTSAKINKEFTGQPFFLENVGKYTIRYKSTAIDNIEVSILNSKKIILYQKSKKGKNVEMIINY
jgi:hypothetical protein